MNPNGTTRIIIMTPREYNKIAGMIGNFETKENIGIKKGDILHFKERSTKNKYTGRETKRIVLAVSKGEMMGIKEGMVDVSIFLFE